MDRRLTKENVIAKTLYGSDVYYHILRQFYPSDFLMRVSGDDCGWNRNPWDNSAPSLHVWMEKVDPDARLSSRIARHHDASGHIPDGTFLDFAELFYKKSGDELLNHSGLLCLNFDHLPDVEELFRKLLQDEYFETMLLFRSPSGDGLKWIIPTDLTECSHTAFFRSVSAYVVQTYGIPVDQSGKDVCRACFLPHDPQAYLNPDYSRAL